MSEKIDWPYWSKLPEVKVFEAIALLNGTEPDCEPPDTEDASPEYRKTLRLLLACLSDGSIFTPGTVNIGDPALHGVKLAEVGLWALANGFVLPDKFPRPVRISKAPPPITPVRGTHHIAPALPPVPPPNWGKWAYMRDLEIWEAVALTLNLEPDQLPVYLGAFDKLGDDPFRICPTPFLERLLVANSNCGISLGFKPVHDLKARCLVDLPEFAAWAVKLNMPNLPPELVALAATTEHPAPAQSPATPAPVLAASDGPAIKVKAPAWSLTNTLHRVPGYRWPLYQVLKAAHADGKPCPKAREVLEAWRLNPPPELEVMTDGVKYSDGVGNTKEANLKAIQQAIKGLLHG